jgi:hypothetical protein
MWASEGPAHLLLYLLGTHFSSLLVIAGLQECSLTAVALLRPFFGTVSCNVSAAIRWPVLGRLKNLIGHYRSRTNPLLESNPERFQSPVPCECVIAMCVCVCARVCVRACVFFCVGVCVCK